MNDNKTQYTLNYMVEFEKGIDLISEHSRLKQIQITTLEESVGLILADDIYAPESIPSFNNSAMDGYAVNSNDLKDASKDNPIELTVIGTTAAGDFPLEQKNTKGCAQKIMTGAAVPNSFDAIIPVENTQLINDKVQCFSSPKLGAHVRKIGEDFIKGEKIISSGHQLNANSIAALSALGVAKVKTYQSISFSLFSTGKELVDDIAQKLKPGQIRNSNKPYIIQWLKALPVEVNDLGTNFDLPEKFATDLQTQLDKNVDIVISSGAVSMGDFDFIPSTIKKLGGEIIFHKSKIKPGKPILFAKFPNGTFYFGLPGNPISAAIGLRFFVGHLIRKMYNKDNEQPITGISQNTMQKKVGFRTIWKAISQVNKSAKLQTQILDGQESFKIKPLINANGWAVLSEEKSQVKAGEKILFYPTKLNLE